MIIFTILKQSEAPEGFPLPPRGPPFFFSGAVARVCSDFWKLSSLNFPFFNNVNNKLKKITANKNQTRNWNEENVEGKGSGK